jgi:hypothetical protein
VGGWEGALGPQAVVVVGGSGWWWWLSPKLWLEGVQGGPPNFISIRVCMAQGWHRGAFFVILSTFSALQTPIHALNLVGSGGDLVGSGGDLVGIWGDLGAGLG